MSRREELYASLDVESDGQCPGINNMLTMGIAMFNDAAELVDRFYARIIQLPDLRPNPQTLIWWKLQKEEAYDEAFNDINANGSKILPQRIPAYDAMLEFGTWISRYDRYRITSLAWPGAFDHPFIKYYCWRFLNECPLGYDCEDIRSYAHGVTRKRNYRDLKEAELRNLIGPVPGVEGLRDHIAIDDAIGQGRLFLHIRDNVAKIKVVNNNEATQ